MGLRELLFGPRRNRTREAATALGLIVEDVDRDCPFFTRQNRFDYLERMPCTRYSLPLASRTSLTWEFLQRDDLAGAAFPNGWTFTSACVDAPAEPLRAVLFELATERDEDFLELECDGAHIHAFWDEWGGAEHAAALHTWLMRAAAAHGGEGTVTTP